MDVDSMAVNCLGVMFLMWLCYDVHLSASPPVPEQILNWENQLQLIILIYITIQLKQLL